MELIAHQYRRLRSSVPADVRIVAVSKFQPAQAVREAIAAGATDFGENYVQEAKAKFAAIDAPHVRKHFIGHVQTNKAGAIASIFDIVQSVDRLDAARALAKGAQKAGKTLEVFLQVNISPAERFGCDPSQAPELAEAIRGLADLRLTGVMAIGPVTDDRALLSQAFATAAAVRERIGVPELSIGMSGDWEQAVQAGSTTIRIGTAIFGPRPAPGVSKRAEGSP